MRTDDSAGGGSASARRVGRSTARTDRGGVVGARATTTIRDLARLLARRPELSGVHAPADLLADMVTWSA